MSTYYKLTNPIPLMNLANNKNFTKNIIIDIDLESDSQYFYDGKNYVHFATDSNDNVFELYRYGANDPDHIIETLTYFNTRIVSEHTEEFHEIHNNDSKIITVSIDEITKERK